MSDKRQKLAIDEFGQPTDTKSARREALITKGVRAEGRTPAGHGFNRLVAPHESS